MRNDSKDSRIIGKSLMSDS